MNKYLLALKDVTISYPNKKIVTGINIKIGEGEIISLVGVNGSGKTTLLKTILGINKIDSGLILKNYKNISYVPQKIQFDSSIPLSVGEFFHIYNPKITEKEINEKINVFSIKNLQEKRISSLSGGELQKVLITNALLGNPEIILLDEPTAGIDVIGEENFYSIISNLREKFPKLSIIIVSHNINIVYKNSSKIICLHGNGKFCYGTPEEISKDKDFLDIFGNYLAPLKHNHKS